MKPPTADTTRSVWLADAPSGDYKGSHLSNAWRISSHRRAVGANHTACA